MSGSTIPAILAVGEVRSLSFDGEDILAIGSEPNGLTVLIAATDWALLRRWKLVRLRLSKGQVWARGGRCGQMAARFLMGVTHDPTTVIRYRNGNALDLRRDNIVVVAYGLVAQARRDTRDPDEPPRLIYRDEGVYAADRRYKTPAQTRLRRLVNG